MGEKTRGGGGSNIDEADTAAPEENDAAVCSLLIMGFMWCRSE